MDEIIAGLFGYWKEAVIASLGAGLAFGWKQVKRVALMFIRMIELHEAMHDFLTKRLPELEQDIDFIAKELRPNGGSTIRDVVTEMAARTKANFRMKAFPAFYCDETGANLEVSDVYLRMLGLSRMSDLERANWMQYVDPAHAEDYFEAFKRASETGSDFSYEIGFRDLNGDNLGIWAVKAQRLDRGRYIGRLYPKNALAEETLRRARH